MAQTPPGEVLLERSAELARIAGRLTQACTGEGALLVVEGPAGIGKTSLLRALRDRALGEGMRVLHARGAELEREFAFGVVRQALEPGLAALHPEARAVATAGQAAHAAPILDPRAAEGSREAVLHGLYWLVANLAEHGPLALVVDDAQWADAPSVDALAYLARRVEHLPVALALATRPPDVDGQPALVALTEDPLAEVIRPAPLGSAGIATLAGVDDPEFVLAAAHATGGNPFLLDQLLRELGPQRTPEAVAMVEPRGLARAVLARLSENARALARAMAVLGSRAGLHECGALAGISDAEAAVHELVLAGIVDDELQFRHPLLEAAVDSELGAVRRSEWHRRAATALQTAGADPERVALHLMKSEPTGDPDATRTLRVAAGAARGRGAPGGAADLLRRALREPPAPEDRQPTMLELGQALSMQGDPEAGQVLLDVSRAAHDPELRTEALTARTWLTGPAEIAEQVRELDATIAGLPAGATSLRLRLESLRLSAGTQDATAMGEMIARAERLGLFTDGAETTPDLLGHLAWWRTVRGEPAAACLPVAERAATLGASELSTTPFRVWYALTLQVLLAGERLDMARTLVDTAERAAVERGSSAWFALTRYDRSQLQRKLGSLLDAEADAAAAVDAAEDAGSTGWMRGLPYGGLISVLAERGRSSDGLAALTRLGSGEHIPDQPAFLALLEARGALRHERGELRAALHDLDEAERRQSAFGPASIIGQDSRLRRALVCHAMSDGASARAIAQQAAGIATRWGTPGAIGGALRVRGLVEADMDALREAISHLAESPSRVEYAKSLLDLGAALRRSNARAEAREPLRQALEIARDRGAEGLATRAEQELEATGARVPARSWAGAASLTPSEARIAQVAAEGLSNKEIAQALFVTVKTVEMHLGNIYRKLEIRSRRDLPRALAE